MLSCAWLSIDCCYEIVGIAQGRDFDVALAELSKATYVGANNQLWCNFDYSRLQNWSGAIIRDNKGEIMATIATGLFGSVSAYMAEAMAIKEAIRKGMEADPWPLAVVLLIL